MSLRSKLKLRTRVQSAARGVWQPAPKPLILMYHRIADDRIDPWGLAVSPANFEEQLRVIRRHRHPLRLTEFVDRLMAGTLPAKAAALTFDDGYVDNLTAGKPRLAAADVPATIFLATGYLNCGEPFWWDELAQLILAGDGMQRCDLVVGGETIHIDLALENWQGEDRGMPADMSEKRHFILGRLWQSLRHLGSDERRSTIATIRSVFARSGILKMPGRAMTDEEVRTIAADGLVAIGAHTVTHPVLAGLDGPACRHEVNESKRVCEGLIGGSIGTFAYPYGDYDAAAREMVRTAGFTIACSTRSAPVDPDYDILTLPRLQVTNVGGDAFEQMLQL
jgi:peptidoglycan/xylan/chitin deacetylase (PgdA/CDA1 family)